MPSPDFQYSAIIVAGGLGTRFSPTENKTTKLLFGQPVLEYALQAFQDSVCVSEIVLVGEAIPSFTAFSSRYPKLTVQVPGGKTRTESVWNGIQAFCTQPDYVFIHDAARPLLESSFVDQMAEQLHLYHLPIGLFPVLPLYDALKSMEKPDFPIPYEGSALYRTQTPQLFHYPTLFGVF